MATNDDLQIRNFVLKHSQDDDAPATRSFDVNDYADRFDFDADFDFGTEDLGF